MRLVISICSRDPVNPVIEALYVTSTCRISGDVAAEFNGIIFVDRERLATR